MILFGMGQLGRATLAELHGKGMNVRAACDNNSKLWGQHVCGVEILSPLEATALYPDEQYVVTVNNSKQVHWQLRGMNITPTHFRDFALANLSPEGEAVKISGVVPPEFYEQHDSEIKRLFGLLADYESKVELDAQIAWRKTYNDGILPKQSPVSETYFPPFLKQNPQEVYVDCGAYNGDTVLAFQKWSPEYRWIFAFEPIFKVNAEATVIPAAVSSRTGFTRFVEQGDASREAREGREVQVMKLDDVFQGIAPTFIKMDIEGAEPEAILGAQRILREHRPVLAVCLYHHPVHLWQIPLLINSIQPDYKLFIRRYSDECWELVCYAIPEERLR